MSQKLPKVDNNYFIERQGVLEVERMANDMFCIWRETSNKDVGIDGQLEYVDENGNATGNIISVQIKSGVSFIKEKDDNIIFYPELKHRQYWENFPLPVIIIIYDPEHKIAYWNDVRRVLRSENKEIALKIPKTQIFNLSQKNKIFESCGALGLKLLSIEDVLRELLKREYIDNGFELSYFDLFVNGITDIGRKLFFSMDLCMQICEFNIEGLKHTNGFSVGMFGHDFIHNYIVFLVSQNLAVIDYSDYLIDYEERYISPVLIVPLTKRGQAVRDLIHKLGSTGDNLELRETIIGIIDWTFIEKLKSHKKVVEKLHKELNI